MGQENNWMERRRYPRYYPDRKNAPKVSFSVNGHENIPVDVVNISQGGMLGYTASNEYTNGNNHKKIKKIEIIFPGKLPFCCSGDLVRTQCTREWLKCFCAVQFDEIGYDKNKNQIIVGEIIEYLLRPIEEVIIPDEIFINRLEKFDNYAKMNNPILVSKIRKNVYDAFDDITPFLSWEEKWCFFEMIDELKRQDPVYSQDLKKAFINLCRVGLEQSLKKSNDLNKSITDN